MRLKHDHFGAIDKVGGHIRRDTRVASLGLRWLARMIAAREARALEQLRGLDGVPQLIAFDGRVLDRGFLEGEAMDAARPRGNLAYFRAARRLLREVHARGIAHNDLAKEANWLVRADGSPAVLDFQLAMRGRPRAGWFRLLAREDLRHLLKHKRTYCAESLTSVERRVLARKSWVARAWMRTGKKVYIFVARKIFHWEDNESRGRRHL